MTTPYTPWTGRVTFPGAVVEPSPSSAALSSAGTHSFQVIPLDPSPNQTFQIELYIDGELRLLQFFIRYNEMADYWVMNISDPSTGETLVDSIPFITGAYPAANLLGQHAYLGLGSAFIIQAGEVSLDYPDDTDLGTDFLLLWSDSGL